MGRSKKTSSSAMGVAAASLAQFRARMEIKRGRSLSYRDLEELTGVSHTRWGPLLAGADPRYSTLEKVAKSDGMTVSQLLALGERAIEDLG